MHSFTPALALSADVVLHRGWSALAAGPDRGFSRAIATVGASYKF